MGLNRDFYLNNISIKLKTVLYDKKDKSVYSKGAEQMSNCGTHIWAFQQTRAFATAVVSWVWGE